MKRRVELILLLVVIFVVGLAATTGGSSAQDEAASEDEPRIVFELESEIGRALPRSILYDENFERYAVVDAYGRLLLVDALTFETQHVLYERGRYNDLLFSNDGRWLALAISSRIELYDTASGELAASLVDLGSAIRIHGPLAFSRDDNLLQFSGTYPAPQSIRQSEDDTIEVPWLWNLTAAREEGPSTFPRGVEAWQFFDYRNGLVIGPEDRIVAALPGRLQVLDAYSLDLLFEIDTNRFEQDPMRVWFSQRDNKIYVRPINEPGLLQVDTQRGVLVDIPLDRALTPDDLDLIGGVELSEQARVIGGPSHTEDLALLEILLFADYHEAFDFNPLTVTLIDILQPPATVEDAIEILLFVYDEAEESGFFFISRPFNISQMVTTPDGQRLLVRRDTDEGERVETYDLATGAFVDDFIPSLRDLGFYSRASKNRVLAYDTSGEVIISDFQRIDAATKNVLAEDLRYARRFDRFFFTDDSRRVVTLSGTEWRVWDVATGEVVRREVVERRGSIVATASDGFELLTLYSNGAEVIDLNGGSIERRSVDFAELRGRIIDVYPSPDWEHYFVVYSPNAYGQYYPGNEVAMYSLDDGFLWFIAGDDLPAPDSRRYGWVNNDTVFVDGEGVIGSQPARVYGLEYDASGLPACAVEAFPEQLDLWTDLWERLVLRLRPDALANLTQLICADLPDTAEDVQQLLLPTATPRPITATPIVIPGVPVCLTARYPDDAQAYAETWNELIIGLNAEEIANLETILCEGIGDFDLPTVGSAYSDVTMLIDVATGERATGSFTPVERVSRPVFPIQEAFEEQFDRSIGTVLLSPDREFIATSNLPGELTIYRLIISYQTLVAPLTQTAEAELAARNLIGVLPSPTPTYNVIGTPRPTLTPTITPTPIPPPQERVEQPQFGEVVELCPAETLFSIDNPPAGYDPEGRIIGPVQDDVLWVVEPEDGRRYPDETIPACTQGVDCRFSPDQQWILARDFDELYVVRPDGTDQRVLFGEDDIWPPEVRWSGNGILEYDVEIEIEEDGRILRVPAIQFDILGVFPDPEPWRPIISVNTIPAQIIARQPGGSLVVVRTTFSTGVNPGYKYYLYDIETGDYNYFARLTEYPERDLSIAWHPTGDRLFYYYPTEPDERVIWYQYTVTDDTYRLLDFLPGGTWSTDGRYRAFRTNNRAQPVGVWDSTTGLFRTYCLPETGARLYNGDFTWSPDSRYIALRAPLPADEADEGVGQHVMIMDVETGEVVDLTTGFGPLVVWAQEPGTYGQEE